MGRHQLIQLLQFIVARILLGLFVVFVMKESFVDFILKYWLYLLIVTISYFYYYKIQYEPEKKYEHIRNIIIYGNIYLFAHIFFRPLLNISHQLFILLGLIILGLWWLGKFKTKWKIVGQILGVILSFFILISGIFYLYPDKPNIQGFIDSRHYTISVFGLNDSIDKTDAYIQIVDSRRSDDFLLEPNFERVLIENCKISYPSIKKDRDEKVVIESPQGDLFLLYPQSEIQLEFSGEILSKVTKLNGRVGFFSGLFDSYIENSFEKEDITGLGNGWVDGMQNLYKSDLVYYLKNQISQNNMSLANNTIMYNLDGIVLKYLAKIFPASFSKNLDNYKEFQNYFALVPNDNVNLGMYFEEKNDEIDGNSFRNNIKNNMKIGWSYRRLGN